MAGLETCSSISSEPVAALGGKRHAVKIAPVDGSRFSRLKNWRRRGRNVRPACARRDMQFDDDAVAGYPKGDDVFEARPRVVAQVARRRQFPRSAIPCRPTTPRHWVTRRCRAMRLKPSPTCGRCMIHSRGSPSRRNHCFAFAGRGFGVVRGLEVPCPPVAQRRDDLPVRRERLRCQLLDIQHVPRQRARIVHGRLRQFIVEAERALVFRLGGQRRRPVANCGAPGRSRPDADNRSPA